MNGKSLSSIVHTLRGQIVTTEAGLDALRRLAKEDVFVREDRFVLRK